MKPSREFQVFVKPVGSLCNMSCSYCYYLNKKDLFPVGAPVRMPDLLLEEYIVQHIEASTETDIFFTWHGGEPTLAGLDMFKRIVSLQKQYKPEGRQIFNGIQTNGTLLNDTWCGFLSQERFHVGISLDGPAYLHDQFRAGPSGESTFEKTIESFRMLKDYGISPEILCVVNAINVGKGLEVYRFIRELGASFITFLPLVERSIQTNNKVTEKSVPANMFGDFLCTVFDEWKNDIGQIKVQIFEEALRSAFNQDHTLCIFKKTCGTIPVVEHDGSFYACDHFVDEDHYFGNIMETSLTELLDHPRQKEFGSAKLESLPACCIECEVRDMCNGECPKNRFMVSRDGEPGLNYLCEGYRKFFNYIKPFIQEVSSAWKAGK